MGLRFRKSKKIAPGVRLNIGKKSASVSFGTKGAHYTINSKGKRTTTVGIPGSGISYTSSSGGGKKKRSTNHSHTKTSSPSNKNNGSCLTTLSLGMLVLLLLCAVIGFIAFVFAFAWIPAIIALIVIPFLKFEPKKKRLLFLTTLLLGILSFVFMLGIDTDTNTNTPEQPIIETELQTELITEASTKIQTEAITEVQTEIETQPESKKLIETEPETLAEIESEISQSKFYYSTDVVNVRNAPSTDSDVIGSLNKSDKIEVITIEDKWASVIYNGIAAYVSAQFLSETLPQTESNEQLVWLPKSGSKFHCNDDCSGMTPSSQVTVSEARSRGYEACQKCAKYIH